MESVSVGRLKDKIIRPLDNGRIPHDRHILIPEVSGKDDLLLLAVLTDENLKNGGPENMARVT